MRRSMLKATSISIAAYAAAVALGFAVDFRLTAFLVAALFVTWTLFCTVRAIQLRIGGAQKPDALTHDRESYGFAHGGCVSSFVVLIGLVVLTQ